jgi:hypothetical protein
MEGYTASVNGSAGNSAPVGGRRRSHKLRLVKKKTVRRMLAKKGLKMRGCGEEMTAPPPAMGGRRKSGKKTRRRRGLFHF